jgi:hypothetical protein
MEALHDCITSLIRDVEVLGAWRGGLPFWKFEFGFEFEFEFDFESEISTVSLITKHDPSVIVL